MVVATNQTAAYNKVKRLLPRTIARMKVAGHARMDEVVIGWITVSSHVRAVRSGVIVVNETSTVTFAPEA